MNRKSTLYILLLCFIVSFNACQIEIVRDEAIIEATIEGLGNDSILAECIPLSAYKKSNFEISNCVIVSVDNKFTYESPFDEPCLIYISPYKSTYLKSNGSRFAPNYIFAFIKPGEKLNITGKIKPYSIKYTVTGSVFNEEFNALRQSYEKELEEIVRLELLGDSLISIKEDKKKIKSIYKRRWGIVVKLRESKLNFIKNNPNSNLSAYLIGEQPLDTIGKYYSKFSKTVLEGPFKERLLHEYNNNIYYKKIAKAGKRVVAGTIAPDFTLKDLTGVERSLKDFNDKIIVLDFWGSWCHWCIKGYPKMKTYYSKYRNKLEYIGIACNDDEISWKQAIKDNELNWVQLLNDDRGKNDLAVLYGVQGYPTKIIIDQDQKIIARYIGESPAFYKKLDELLK